MRAFTAKGRVSSLLETIPVHVVLEDRTALLGAAAIAADELGLLV
jgi:glucokinase